MRKIILILNIFLVLISCTEKEPEIIQDIFFEEHDESDLPEETPEPADYKNYNAIDSNHRESYIYDDFIEESSNWSEINNGYFSVVQQNGYLHVKNNYSNTTYIYQKSVIGLQPLDFEIEYIVKRLDKKAFNEVGFSWGGSSDPLKIFYIILSDAYGLSVEIGEYDGGIETWTVDSSLESYAVESYDYNKFTIRKIDSQYYFFVNEKLFFNAAVKDFYGNKVGIYMGSISEAYFDEIRIDKLINLD